MKYAALLHVYNEEDFLGYVLNAIRNQDVPPSYWFIVNDGSNDKTREIIENYNVDSIYLEQQKGMAAFIRRSNAFNIGISHIRKKNIPLVLKVDGDTMIDPAYAGELARHFDETHTAAVSGASYEFNKLRNLNNGAVMYRLSMLPDAKPVYGWDKEIELDLISKGYNAYVDPTIFYTDLRPPAVIRPRLSRVISNRFTRKKAEIIGSIRRNIK